MDAVGSGGGTILTTQRLPDGDIGLQSVQLMLQGLPEGHQRVLWGQLPGKGVVRGELRFSSRAPPQPRAELPCWAWSSLQLLQAIPCDGAQPPPLLNHACPAGSLGGSGKQGWLGLVYINVGVQSSAYGSLGPGV